MASFLNQLIVFANRVLHLMSTMFVAGMCTISYLADNNLFGNSQLQKYSTLFGAIVLITGLIGIYNIHKWFKYWTSDRYVRTYIILIVVKLLTVFTLT
jgi:hypothetical protein